MDRKQAELIEVGIIQALADEKERLGMSYDDLSADTGLDRTAISLILRKKRHPTLLSIIRISAALDLKLSAIIRKVNSKL